MASLVYTAAKKGFGTAVENWTGNTYKAMLVTSSYSPSAEDVYASAASGNELSGTGYVAGFGNSGRKSLAGKAVNIDAVNHRALFQASNPTWTAINAGTAGYVIILREVTDDAHSPLIACLDFADVVTNGGDLTIVWDTNGLFYF